MPTGSHSFVLLITITGRDASPRPFHVSGRTANVLECVRTEELRSTFAGTFIRTLSAYHPHHLWAGEEATPSDRSDDVRQATRSPGSDTFRTGYSVLERLQRPSTLQHTRAETLEKSVRCSVCTGHLTQADPLWTIDGSPCLVVQCLVLLRLADRINRFVTKPSPTPNAKLMVPPGYSIPLELALFPWLSQSSPLVTTATYHPNHSKTRSRLPDPDQFSLTSAAGCGQFLSFPYFGDTVHQLWVANYLRTSKPIFFRDECCKCNLPDRYKSRAHRHCAAYWWIVLVCEVDFLWVRCCESTFWFLLSSFTFTSRQVLVHHAQLGYVRLSWARSR